jgi:hypothetical protein
MTEEPKEPGTVLARACTVPIHLTPSPDLVDLALAYFADGTIFDPETPALLRRIAAERLAAGAAHAPGLEPVAPPRLPGHSGFVLVDYEIRPGIRGYRLAMIPKNVWWRIRIGAFERNVHRTFVILWRRLVRFVADRTTLALEWKAGILARRAGSGAVGPELFAHRREGARP